MICIIALAGIALRGFEVHGSSTDAYYNAYGQARTVPFEDPEVTLSLSPGESVSTTQRVLPVRYIALNTTDLRYAYFRDQVTITMRAAREKWTNDPIVDDQEFLDLGKGIVRASSAWPYSMQVFTPSATKIVIRTKGVNTGSKGTNYFVRAQNGKTSLWNEDDVHEVELWSKKGRSYTLMPNTGLEFDDDGEPLTTTPSTNRPDWVVYAGLGGVP